MITNAKLSMVACLVLGGCLADPSEVDDSTPAASDQPATGVTEQSLAPPSNHYYRRDFGGSLFSQAFNYVSEDGLAGGPCTLGYRRPAAPTVWWTSQAGGNCSFMMWNTTDIHDCRARIQGSTGGGFFGGTCESTVAEIAESPSFSYTAVNTSSAQVATTNFTIPLRAGQRLTIGTCGITGASFSGDTYLRLFNESAVEVAANDDACGGLGSQLTFTAPNDQTFNIHAGCYSNTSCSATVAWTIQ